MRQSGWFKQSVTWVCALQQHWSTTLFGISVVGTFLATILLLFDGWVDALAVYLVSGLMLAVLLSQLAGRQTLSRVEASIDSGMHNPADPQSGLIFKRAPRAWFNRVYHTPGSNVAVSPATLSKVVSTD